MYNVADPLNPALLHCDGSDGYVHDAQCFMYSGPDTEHQGAEVRTHTRAHTRTHEHTHAHT